MGEHRAGTTVSATETEGIFGPAENGNAKKSSLRCIVHVHQHGDALNLEMFVPDERIEPFEIEHWTKSVVFFWN